MDSFAFSESADSEKQSRKALSRLLPRLEAKYKDQAEEDEWAGYVLRLEKNMPRLFRNLHALYGKQYDFFYHLECILASATEMWLARSSELRALDAMREADPNWYQSHRMIGAMCYVDHFAGSLSGIAKKIPYFSELGITYIHLMPLYKSPEGDDDGGYAVSSYREVSPELGTMEELEHFSALLRHRGISLVLDYVFNHTSDEHEWAQRALAGDEDYQDFFRMYADRDIPDAYERTIDSVFPEEHPGCFTYQSRLRKWVWTTFHNYQWDLNYENPEVFNRMMEDMLFLANRGVEVLRLDAVAFCWKRVGTSCQNLPEAHLIVQAFNAVKSIVAPALVFKSEAIVHPDEVRKYIDVEECELSYNPQLMACIWEALATRDTRLLRSAMEQRFEIPDACAWVNYVRCHDDIGWGFADSDAMALGMNPDEHRKFLTKFYTGVHSASFARGAPFQEDSNGQARVSGTCASLAGLEAALEAKSESLTELAIQRILLIHGIIMTIGGIPLIYLGDEIGTLNDHDYEDDPDNAGDSRWLHRSEFDWERAEDRSDVTTVAGRIFQGMARLSQLRQQNMAFTRTATEVIDAGNDHVFAYFCTFETYNVLILANFTEKPQVIEARRLRQLGMRKTVTDLVSGKYVTAMKELQMDPYQFMVVGRLK